MPLGIRDTLAHSPERESVKLAPRCPLARPAKPPCCTNGELYNDYCVAVVSVVCLHTLPLFPDNLSVALIGLLIRCFATSPTPLSMHAALTSTYSS